MPEDYASPTQSARRSALESSKQGTYVDLDGVLTGICHKPRGVVEDSSSGETVASPPRLAPHGDESFGGHGE